MLSLYTIYISIAALNGVSEAFYHSTGRQNLLNLSMNCSMRYHDTLFPSPTGNLSDLGRNSILLTITVLGQSTLGWALGSGHISLPAKLKRTLRGSKGIILAMMLGMGIRIVAAFR